MKYTNAVVLGSVSILLPILYIVLYSIYSVCQNIKLA